MTNKTTQTPAIDNGFTVPLGKLKPSEKNVRRYQSEAGLAELATSLEHHGQLQNLNVRKGDKGVYEVVAGARRLAALKRLMSEGRSVKGVKVTKDFPVRVVSAAENDSDIEISLAENIERSDMHPADEIEAYKKLHEEEGLTPEQISDRFGISHMTVRRRLKLANVSPRILEEFRQNNMSLEQMQALALSDDHEAQEKAWFEAEYNWARRPDTLRERLTNEQVRGSDRLVKFVGLDAYTAAGGGVVRDLFSEADEVFLTDRQLLQRLALEKLQAAAAQINGEGWKWVMPTLESASNYQRIFARHTDPSEEDQAKLDKLQERRNGIEDAATELDEDSTEYQTLVEELDLIDADIKEINARYVAYNPMEKAVAGVLVYIGYDGKIEIDEGRVAPEDSAELARVRNKTERIELIETIDATKQDDEQDGPALSFAVIEDLTALRTVALQLAVAERPDVALCAIIHPLAIQLFYKDKGFFENAVEISNAFRGPRQLQADSSNHSAFDALDELHETWAAKMPADRAALWDWLTEQNQGALMQLLAYVTSRAVNAWQHRHTGHTRLEMADQIAAAVSLDMNKWWKPSAEFFSRVPKSIAIAAVREAGINESVCKGMEKDTKADAVSTTLEHLRDTGWLPLCLRPRTVERVEAAEDDLDEDIAAAAE
ncbi:chromosome partitioning protein ParB [Brucella endophytica]|uniref:Chromosome partitioning protein ParB n=1 Tax=Brucella endophytica TaxID=1963359 RepID=A0A916WLI9_9HYPH|nr:ParB/RepB/Spo0J family partition protein [Brucella endophytica]GGB09505.1 chromosome partitioning protein ParB [Brucella endophytica]